MECRRQYRQSPSLLGRAVPPQQALRAARVVAVQMGAAGALVQRQAARRDVVRRS